MRQTIIAGGIYSALRLLLFLWCAAASALPIRTGTFIIPFAEKPNTADITKKLKFVGILPADEDPGDRLLEPKGLFFNSNGDLYVVDSANARVVVFSGGKLTNTIGHFGWDADGFVRPRAIAIDQELYIYVSDEERNVVIQFDIYGKFIKTIGGGTGAAELYKPSGLAVDKIGNLWVCDTGNHLVKEFDSSGQVVREIGGYGWDEGRFNSPSDIALDRNGQIYIADSGNSRIQVFDKFGNYILSFGGREEGPGQLNFPSGICVDPKGNVYVSDTGNDMIKVFLFDGTVLLAEHGYFGTSDTRLNRPTGVAMSPGGNLYVADTFNNVVKYFSVEYEMTALEAWHYPRIEPAGYEEPGGDTGSVDSSETLGEHFDDLWGKAGPPDGVEVPPDYVKDAKVTNELEAHEEENSEDE